MNTKMARIVAFLSTLLLAFPAQAVTFWEDDFESQLNAGGSGPWDTSQCVVYLGISAPAADGCTVHNNPARTAQAFARSGTHVFERSFQKTTTDKGVMILRSHPGTTNVWIRFWYRRSTDYIAASNGITKFFYLRNTGSGASPVWEQDYFGKFWLAAQFGGSMFCPTSNRVDGACNYYSNTGNNPPFAADTWYCVELHTDLGTIGNADGTIEAWVNGVKTMDHVNVPMMASPTSLVNLGNYVQWGTSGSSYIDDLAVGNTQIGCGAPPSIPSPPANLTVQ
jgi:hypothetical protein